MRARSSCGFKRYRTLIFEKHYGLILLGRFYATAITFHAGTICTSLHFIATLGFAQDLLHLREAFASQDQQN